MSTTDSGLKFFFALGTVSGGREFRSWPCWFEEVMSVSKLMVLQVGGADGNKNVIKGSKEKKEKYASIVSTSLFVFPSISPLPTL